MSVSSGHDVVSAREPQHNGNLITMRDSGQEKASCIVCGRQWEIHGSHIKVILPGDGYCDQQQLEEEDG